MFNKNFYPTPDDLISKMLEDVNLNYLGNILEPSAGKGNIVDYMVKRWTHNRWSHPDIRDYDVYKSRIDTIEKSGELQATLKGKNYRVIHDDFLTFDTYKRYDLIIMNPPFDNGDKHLLKALDIQRRGGQIVCLLNAETLKNPYSNTRKDLLKQLDYYNADIEYLESEFANAERTTNVEVALIKVNIENNNKDSLIFDTLKNEIDNKEYSWTEKNQIITNDPIDSAIQNYNLEIKAGLKLIFNYFDLVPLISRDLQAEKGSPILVMGVAGQRIIDTDIGIINDYIEEVRYKYWKALINMNKFRQLLTSELVSEMHEKLNELRNYDFTRFNINEVINELMLNMNKSLHTTIMDLFDDLTYRYTYNDYSGNIHLYNGWKTNQGYKINDKKVIIPLAGYSDWNSYRSPYFSMRTEVKIRDIQKSLEYLEGGKTEGYDNIQEILKQAEEDRNDFVEFKYFKIKFYKKGTAHIHWKDKELVKKLNIYGGIDKGWLPNDYGKDHYGNLSKEKQTVIDEFEGEKSYNDTINNKAYYLSKPSVDKLMLM